MTLLDLTFSDFSLLNPYVVSFIFSFSSFVIRLEFWFELVFRVLMVRLEKKNIKYRFFPLLLVFIFGGWEDLEKIGMSTFYLIAIGNVNNLLYYVCWSSRVELLAIEGNRDYSLVSNNSAVLTPLFCCRCLCLSYGVDTILCFSFVTKLYLVFIFVIWYSRLVDDPHTQLLIIHMMQLW